MSMNTRASIRSMLTALGLSLAAAGGASAQTAPPGSFENLILDVIRQNPHVVLEALNSLAGNQAQVAARPSAVPQQQAAAPQRPELAGPDVLRASLPALQSMEAALVYGNPDATNVIYEFVDYRCSFCRRVHPTIKELLAAEDDVKVVLRQFPILGDDSVNASRVVLAAMKQDRDLARALSDHFIEYNGSFTLDALVDVAVTEFDFDRARLAEDATQVDHLLIAERTLASRLGITGTPAFVFGDMRIVPGARSLDVFQAQLADLRRHNAAAVQPMPPAAAAAPDQLRQVGNAIVEQVMDEIQRQ